MERLDKTAERLLGGETQRDTAFREHYRSCGQRYHAFT